MVYINSRGEVVDDTNPHPMNIFWKFITFFVMFFKSLIGIDDKPDRKKDSNIGGSGPVSGGSSGGGSGGSGGGNSNKWGPNDNKGRRFGPRGFKSVTDLSPPPTPMMGCSSGGCCG